MFPNPVDAFTNPVRYWSDVFLFQAEISRQAYEVACMMNPCLPRVDFATIAICAPASPRVAVRRDADVPDARPLPPLPPLALPKQPVTARPATSRPEHPRASSTTRKGVVTLAPDLPPSKLFDGT
jgi:hypothetical protein